MKKMKSTVVLFAGNSCEFQFDKAFGFDENVISAVDSSIRWASSLSSVSEIHVFASKRNEAEILSSLKAFAEKKYELITKEDDSVWSTCDLLSHLSSSAAKTGADYVIYASASCPFLNVPLTEKLIETHTEYKAEYTFADGYPAGFAPEIIDSGTISILSELSKTVSAESGKLPVNPESIFSIIKGDINSFEIETEIPDHDFRLLRMNFNCERKTDFESCKALVKVLKENGKLSLITEREGKGDRNVMDVSYIASKSPEVLRTVPAFYNIQIEGKCGHSCAFCPYPSSYEKKFGKKPVASPEKMSLENFKRLCGKISDFSDTAWVSLSLWGEAILNPELDLFVSEILKYKGLGCLVECSAFSLETMIASGVFEKIRDACNKAESRKNGSEKIVFIVSLDAQTEALYGKLHGGNFENAVKSIAKLNDIFNGSDASVYSQFLRMEENEEELEGFFRFWKEKESPTGGKFIIQKYDHFLKTLPEVKTADLSPLKREPCWHLRRDMEILFDGSVPFCRETVLENVIGNAFDQELSEIWEKKNDLMKDQVNGIFDEKCRNCDEYYTFNF